MPGRGTAPMVPQGEFAEFIAALIMQAPIHMRPAIRKRWVDNQELLRNGLKELLIPGPKIEWPSYTIRVSYKGQGGLSRDVRLYFVKYSIGIDSAEILEDLEVQGLSPATSEELSVLTASEHAHVLKGRPMIIALGSTIVREQDTFDRSRGTFATALRWRKGKTQMCEEAYYGKWENEAVFLAVDKVYLYV